MNSVENTKRLLNDLAALDSGWRGMEWASNLAHQYMDGLITFGEMLDKVVSDSDNCTDGAKFDLLLAFGFSLEEAKRLIMG